MKKIIILLFLCFPILAKAQTDSKYLEGAVSLSDGKVVFSTEMQVPAMTKEQTFEPSGSPELRSICEQRQ